ncbi:ATP-binding cassette subfamily B protein [Luteococcus japonicus]|uniref:Fatty acid ABC transporter ATP-binding/permease protein n=2 Tax=Luteococcus japonicus TaxID=33984 RepID=A0A3N1ZWG5_9ACTN|nr:ABC transporter ATP-binding protein [Luteococcus japonicus]ROR55146.1 ATP-binding cassette subfamily B protein [Luteococcus japonicus]
MSTPEHTPRRALPEASTSSADIKDSPGTTLPEPAEGMNADQAAAAAVDAQTAPARPKHGGRAQGPMGMSMGGEKPVNFGVSLRRLLGHLRPERPLIGGVILMAAVGVGANVVGPKILGKATDVIFTGAIGQMLGQQFPAGTPTSVVVERMRAGGGGQFADMVEKMGAVPGVGIDYDRLGHWLLLALALFVGSSLLGFAQGWLLNGVVQRSIYRMRQEVSSKLDRLPLSYFDKQPRGELLSRVTNDIDNVSQTLQQTLSQLLNALLTLVGVLAMMFWVSWQLALVTLLIIPVSGVLAGIIGKRSQKLFAQMWKSTGELNGHIEEAYSGHALVKTFGRQKEVEQVFAQHNDGLFRSAFGAQFISGIIMPVMFFVGNLNYVVIAVVGGLKVAHGSMQLGDVQAFIQYSRMFTQPVTQVASMSNLLQSGVASAERVFQVLDAPEQSPEATGSLPEPISGRVVFEDVRFRYLPERPLIDGLDLVAEPGQTVAIVGPTGAGKTTLVNLLMRFYELQGGRITLDGVDISSVPRRELRDRMGMVLQDTWLFGGTIRENIAYGRPGATEEEIIAAATAAYVDRFVHSLPDGYDTVIDEEGSNVSAGEKQLITIARAFLSDPSLLILDEATSSVDTRTEVLVQQAMAALRSDRTSFVIAHRLSTIRDADLILVMEHGAIVEQGTHHELLEAKEHYHDLYQAQFAAPLEDDAA